VDGSLDKAECWCCKEQCCCCRFWETRGRRATMTCLAWVGEQPGQGLGRRVRDPSKDTHKRVVS